MLCGMIAVTTGQEFVVKQNSTHDDGLRLEELRDGRSTSGLGSYVCDLVDIREGRP